MNNTTQRPKHHLTRFRTLVRRVVSEGDDELKTVMTHLTNYLERRMTGIQCSGAHSGPWLNMRGLFGITALMLVLLSYPIPVRAEEHLLRTYHGGPILHSFTIYPLFYGNWDSSDIKTQYDYLVNVAAFMSGNNRPAGQEPGLQPTTWQYGVTTVRVAPWVKSSAPALGQTYVGPQEILKIIHTNQTPGSKVVCTPPIKPTLPPNCHTEPIPAKLPSYSPNTLIMVYLGKDYSTDHCDGCGYHSAESSSKFFAVIPAKVYLLDRNPAGLGYLAAHEVYEAATNPAGHRTLPDGTVYWVTDGSHPAEAADAAWVVDVTFEISDDCPAGDTSSFGLIHDNTQGGACSTNGYINWANWTAATLSSGHVTVPDDAVVGGQDIDGHALYVCRTGIGWSTQYGQTPGKFQVNFNGCHFASGGDEREAPEFEFLVSSWASDQSGHFPPNAVQNGTGVGRPGFPGIPLYVCRGSSAATANSLTPGYIGPGTGGCRVSYGGVSVTLTSYEVLVKAGNSPLPLSTVHVSDGSVPLGSLRGGKDSDGTPLYLCSAKNGTGNFPGKLRADFSNCLIAVAEQEVWVPIYDVLVPSWTGFSTSTPKYDFPAGRDRTDGITPLYSCRSSVLDGMQTGTMVGAGCDVGFAGTVHKLSPPFDVLSSK